MFRFCRGVARVTFSSWRWRVTGREHVPAEGPFIVAPNHVSYLDPPAVGAAIARPIHFMAKKELFDIPGLGWLISRIHAFPVRRGVGDRRAIAWALGVLKKGGGLLLFPEGTRSPSEKLLRPDLGVGLLALRSGAPVVPVGLVGIERAMPYHSWIIRPKRFEVRIGRPLHFTCAGAKPSREEMQRVADRVIQAIAELTAKEIETEDEWKTRQPDLSLEKADGADDE